MQAARDVHLAAADDATRRRCVRIIEAASAGGASSSLPDIASSAALTRGLLDMKSGAAVKAVLAALGVAIDHQRDLAEILDVAPLTLDNLYNIIDRKNGAARVHLLTDKVLFDSQTVKEMCNLLHLRQLGCSTGTLQDFGPDFGISYILDGLAAMGQK